jgi:hypothetical protein
MDGRFIVQNGVTRACVVFGLSGFPSRKENGLLSSRAPRERNRTIERSSEDGAPSNGELNSRKAGKGWKQVPFKAKGLTLGWKHPGNSSMTRSGEA